MRLVGCFCFFSFLFFFNFCFLVVRRYSNCASCVAVSFQTTVSGTHAITPSPMMHSSAIRHCRLQRFSKLADESKPQATQAAIDKKFALMRLYDSRMSKELRR
jgi:hypothetical protein